jgi:hypothetical protein
MTKKIVSIIIILALYNCTYITAPPTVDLAPFNKIGLITFEIENAEGVLDEMATGIFLSQLHGSQEGVRIIEVGKKDEILKKIKSDSLDSDSIKTISKNFGVNAVLHGKITVSNIVPRINIRGLLHNVSIIATFTMTAEAKLFSARDGATLWANSTTRRGTAAYVHMTKSLIPYFDVRDMDESYRKFVRKIIFSLTRDFRPLKRKRS